MHPRLVDDHESPLRPYTRPTANDAAFAGPSRKSRRWFGVHHHPCGVSSHVQIPALEHSQHAAEASRIPSELGRPSPPNQPSGSSRPPGSSLGAYYADASTTTPHRTYDTAQRLSEDVAPYVEQRTSRSSSLSSFSRSPSPTVISKPRCPRVVSIHGGRTVPTPDTSTNDNPMSLCKTALLPPHQLRSMASLTTFAIDSTRALRVVNDLASRGAHSEKRAASAHVPWASTSRFSSREKVPRLVPASFPTAYLPSSTSPTASPYSSPTVLQSPSPIFQHRRPETPALAEPYGSIVFQAPSFSPPPEPTGQPPLRPAASAFPLVYVVTAPDQVTSISSTGTQPSPSSFLHSSVSLHDASPEASRRHGSKSPSPGDVRREEPPAKKHRGPRSQRTSSGNVPQVVPEQATTLEQDIDVPRYGHINKDSIGQPDPEPDVTRDAKLRCRWPGCTFSDDPSKLWVHIKSAHGEEGTSGPNDSGPQWGAAVESVTSFNDDVAVPVAPPLVSSIQGWPPPDAAGSYNTNFWIHPSMRPIDAQDFRKFTYFQPFNPFFPYASMSAQAQQINMPPRPKVWAMGFTDSTVQDGWFVNTTTGLEEGPSQQEAQRKRKRSVREVPVQNKKPTRPAPIPFEQGPLYRQCLWIKDDGALCLQGGTADDVWAHMRTEHGMDKFAVTEAPRFIECGWPGCPEKGTPDDLVERCETKHKEEAKAAIKAENKDLKSTPAQCRICDAWVRVDGIGRHVDERHWKSNKRTRFCDICGRRERHEKFFSQHHFIFCLDGFMQARPEFRIVR